MNLKVMTERHRMGVEMKDPGDTGERTGKGVKIQLLPQKE